MGPSEHLSRWGSLVCPHIIPLVVAGGVGLSLPQRIRTTHVLGLAGSPSLHRSVFVAESLGPIDWTNSPIVPNVIEAFPRRTETREPLGVFANSLSKHSIFRTMAASEKDLFPPSWKVWKVGLRCCHKAIKLSVYVLHVFSSIGSDPLQIWFKEKLEQPTDYLFQIDFPLWSAFKSHYSGPQCRKVL